MNTRNLSNNYIILVFALLFICGSCTNDKVEIYNYNGVNFYFPGDWKAENKVIKDSTGVVIILQEKGLSPSAILTISKFNIRLDLSELLNLHKTEFENNSLIKRTNVLFEPEKSSVILNEESRSLDYSFSLAGLRFKGILHALHKNDRTILIMKQGTAINWQKNTATFKMIEESLIIE